MTREEAIEKLRLFDFIGSNEDEEFLTALNMAIEALEHPEKNVVAVVPCGDVISRQAVIDKAAYTETEEGWSGMTVNVKDIEKLPSVKPEQKWIPVSERLPKCGVFVLVTCMTPYDNLYFDILKRTNNGSYKDHNNFYNSDSVIAWMPLPKPYKVSLTGEEVEE